MATDYNVYNPDFPGKLTCLQTSGCTSAGPQSDWIHAVNVHPSTLSVDRLYVRDGAVPESADLRLYDIGKTQLCSQAFQGPCQVGELWVHYDVTLYKPKLDTQINSGLEGPGLVSSFMPSEDMLATITTFDAKKFFGTTTLTTPLWRGRVGDSLSGIGIVQLPPCGPDLPIGVTGAPDFITWVPTSGIGGVFAFKEIAVGKYFRIEFETERAVNALQSLLIRNDIPFNYGSAGSGIAFMNNSGLGDAGYPLVSIMAPLDTPGNGISYSALPVHGPVATATPGRHSTVNYIKVLASGYLDDGNAGTGTLGFVNMASTASDFASVPAYVKITFREVPGPGLVYADRTQTLDSVYRATLM